MCLLEQEKEIENRVKQDFFNSKIFDITRQIGRIDFCISYKKDTLFQPINFLWAEAKRGNKTDIIESFIQLILTIGKERTYENELPPLFLGAFDSEKIAFIPYHDIMFVFSQNDFNWNVTPSNHKAKEFHKLYESTKELLESKKLEFNFKEDFKDLQIFIKTNFTLDNKEINKIPINKNNFTIVYQKWLLKVKDSIWINWEEAKKVGIIDADFFLADLLNIENKSIKDKLFVILQHNHYELMHH